MGLEITKKTELNQYEIINHKSNVRLWLHDVVDGLIVPGLVTAENLIAGVTLGLDDLYASSDHNHDAAYAALAHDHDDDYADIAHNHDADYTPLGQGLGAMTASWLGDGNATRTINLSSSVGIQTLLFMVLMSWKNSSTYALRLWSNVLATGILYGITNAGCAVDTAQWTFTGGDTSLDIVGNINQSSWYYRLFMLGWRTT